MTLHNSSHVQINATHATPALSSTKYVTSLRIHSVVRSN